jgi:uncharacterized membrane protein YqjE
MSERAASGLFASLRHLLGDVLDIGRTRLALLANEVEEEKLRLASVVVHGVFAVASAILGVVLLLAFLLAIFWENRLIVLGGGALVFAGLALAFARSAEAGLKRGSALFAASLSELETDVASLRREDDGASPAP